MNTILLIEDNQSYRETLVELLQLEGYLTLAAANGHLGLQMMKEYLPSLVLCDMNMPMMSGFEVLQIKSADPLLSAIPFLILSAQTDGEMQAKFDDAGAQAVLSKTIVMEKLLAVIAHFLSHQHKSI